MKYPKCKEYLLARYPAWTGTADKLAYFLKSVEGLSAPGSSGDLTVQYTPVENGPVYIGEACSLKLGSA